MTKPIHPRPGQAVIEAAPDGHIIYRHKQPAFAVREAEAMAHIRRTQSGKNPCPRAKSTSSRGENLMSNEQALEVLRHMWSDTTICLRDPQRETFGDDAAEQEIKKELEALAIAISAIENAPGEVA